MYIPRPGQTPLKPPPDIPLNMELEVNRYNTDVFISTRPVGVRFIPRRKVIRPGGAYAWEDMPQKPLQIFRVIPSGSAFTGEVESGDGSERQYEFILLGSWSSDVEIGYHWVDSDDNRWVVGGHLPYNGYETKSGLYSYGSKPSEVATS